MSSKKSKKKKHKKEERISSISSHEDEKKERDAKRFSNPKRKHKHHHRHVSSDQDKAKEMRAKYSTSPRGFEGRFKKTEVSDSKSREERSRESQATENFRPVFKSTVTHEKEQLNPKRKHENLSPNISGSSSTRHAATNQPSSKELEKKRRELVSRRSTAECPRRIPAKDEYPPEKLQEKRRKLMKRPLSPELHAEPRRRDIKYMTNAAHAESHSEVQKEMRKTLMATRCKKINPNVDTQRSHNKPKEALPVVKHEESGSKLKSQEDVSPKKPEHVQLGNEPGVNLGEKRTSLGGPTAKVSFKIPKKASAVKAWTNTNVCNVNSSEGRTQSTTQPSFPGSTPSKHTYLITQQQGQRPQKVSAQTSHKPTSLSSSHLSSISHQVQEAHTDKTREVTTPNNTSCNVQHVTPQEAAETFDCDHEMELVEELHLARSERRLEVKLVENCGELTCMDIDPPEEGAGTMLKNQHKQGLLIVLDTNVLLSHLDFVKKIRTHGLGGLGFPTLLIPWVVLQELDYLKSGKLSSKVEDKARPAVHYIYSCLKCQEPRLVGQSMQQASQAVGGPGVVNNDDRVLQCCLQYQALYPEGAVVLCTNDKNLCSKALLSGVKALSKADLVKEVEGTRSTIINYIHALPTVPPSARPLEKAEEEGSQNKRHSDAAEERQLSECVSLLESCLQGALSEVLEEEMKAAYGELWTEIVYVKPPWNLEGLLKCFKKHWIAVFGSIIKRSLLRCVEMLSDCLCSDRSIEHISFLSALRLAAELLSALASRSQYNGHVAQALSTIHMLQQRLQSPKAPVEGNDTDKEDSLMAEIEEDVAPPPRTSHQEVWALFESIWNNVCQISSSLFSVLNYTPGATEPRQRSTSPPPQEALSCLQRLSTALKQLLEALQRLLSAGSSVQDAQSLLSFIQTSEIAATEPRFTATELFNCVSQQEYREKLCVGGAQLSELYVNLDHCAAALSSWP
ncbi:transcriptional protein SWT1 isoform X1 [Carassius gibelio]|uniref:transcriptional protein SWT1 isoform X1 n=1 Tax=Carassius gibelio TaxID=101364 RepID=UPI00227768B7|nr:transcriptional protein SWT1 isoform X1 [Carassius gibelio]XP_052391472.1 transcriptional protein SWT1 isoform X1 [Carassius gibelio]